MHFRQTFRPSLHLHENFNPIMRAPAGLSFNKNEYSSNGPVESLRPAYARAGAATSSASGFADSAQIFRASSFHARLRRNKSSQSRSSGSRPSTCAAAVQKYSDN